MRDALLALIVLGLVGSSILSSVYALLGYLWFALMRPDVLAWASERPYSFILGLVAILSAIRDVPWANRLSRNVWVWLFLALSGWYLLSVLTSQGFAESALAFRIFLPALATSVLIPLVIRTRENFRRMMIVIAFSVGLVGVKFGLWGLMLGGVRIVSGYGGALSDNNILGLGLVTVLPLCWCLRDALTSWWARLAAMGLAFLVAAAAVQTHSRGALLSLALIVPLMAWRSRNRILTMVLLVLLLVPAVYLVRDSLFDRMNTLNVEEESELDYSAQSRLRIWRGAWKMALDYPITGIGFGGSPFMHQIHKYMDGEGLQKYAHNNYVQILADSGFPALFLYCGLLFGQILWLGRLYRRLKETDREMAAYAAGLQVALIGFGMSSIFLSRTYYDFPYYLFMAGAAFGPLAQEVLEASARARTAARAPVPGMPAPPLNPPVRPGEVFAPPLSRRFR